MNDAAMPAGDLSQMPGDWLEAYAEMIAEGGELDRKISAIFRMRDIERREGRTLTAHPAAVLAELAQRQDPDGSKRRAAETASLMAERAEVEECIADYRRGNLKRLLRRHAAIEARLAELGPPA